MKTIYTVYQLNEKTNKLGNPYIGFTKHLRNRSTAWKRDLKLDYIPELIPLYTDTSAQRAFDWEQDKRVELGWRRERPLRHLRNISKKAASKNRTKKQIENASQLGKKYGAIVAEKRIKSIKEKVLINKSTKHYSVSVLGGKANAKLTSKVGKLQANIIKIEYESTNTSTHKLAKKYGFKQNIIWRIVKGLYNTYRD
jgi:hypothetical protein